jgi:hypothetical protein
MAVGSLVAGIWRIDLFDSSGYDFSAQCPQDMLFLLG